VKISNADVNRKRSAAGFDGLVSSSLERKDVKLILIILMGAVIQTMIEGFLSVKFGHWYDRLIFQVMAGIYGAAIGYVILKN
jgi:hypothetical protein